MKQCITWAADNHIPPERAMSAIRKALPQWNTRSTRPPGRRRRSAEDRPLDRMIRECIPHPQLDFSTTDPEQAYGNEARSPPG